MWHDRPTSFPPPKHRNISSSEGSTGSSEADAAIADALRLEAIVFWLDIPATPSTDRDFQMGGGSRPASTDERGTRRGGGVAARRDGTDFSDPKLFSSKDSSQIDASI